MSAVLVLALALGAASPAAAPAAGFAVDGVPMAGLAGTVERQRSERGGVTLFAAGREVRVAPWPWPGSPPRLVGQALRATVEPHPEGPTTRVELGSVTPAPPRGQRAGREPDASSPTPSPPHADKAGRPPDAPTPAQADTAGREPASRSRTPTPPQADTAGREPASRSPTPSPPQGERAGERGRGQAAPRWVFLSRARGGTDVAGGVSLGTHVAMRGKVAEVLLLVGKTVVATPRAGRAARVRAAGAWWCVAVPAVEVPPPAPRGLSDDRREARVDVAARRLSGPRERCAAR